MYFYLTRDGIRLRCFVGRDAGLYWSAAQAADYLGARRRYLFCRGRATLRASEILYEDGSDFRVKVLPHADFVERLSRKKMNFFETDFPVTVVRHREIPHLRADRCGKNTFWSFVRKYSAEVFSARAVCSENDVSDAETEPNDLSGPKDISDLPNDVDLPNDLDLPKDFSDTETEPATSPLPAVVKCECPPECESSCRVVFPLPYTSNDLSIHFDSIPAEKITVSYGHGLKTYRLLH